MSEECEHIWISYEGGQDECKKCGTIIDREYGCELISISEAVCLGIEYLWRPGWKGTDCLKLDVNNKILGGTLHFYRDGMRYDVALEDYLMIVPIGDVIWKPDDTSLISGDLRLARRLRALLRATES